MTDISPDRLAKLFVQVADTLVDEFDLIAFLQMVTSSTSELVEARAAGLLLADSNDRLQLMAASDERAEMLELFQVQADEGPCQDCFHRGEPITVADLEGARDRWPNFAPRAVDAGYRSVHAFPMRLRQQVIGALNLFGTEVGLLSETDALLVQALADVATIGLIQERAIRQQEILTDQLQTALNSRILIEQAKGALAQVLGSTPDEAFEWLRSYCRRRGLKLSEVARSITSDPSALRALVSGAARRGK
jgi:transcriptional regulator with GAF, ATPase, and Fis domain